MRAAQQTIEPPMQNAGGTPGPGAVLRYEQGKVYNFTTDLIPDFLIQNATKTKLYIQKPFKEHAAGFDKLIETGGNLHYKISVSGTKYQGLTRNAYNPKTFYESARKEGALELEEIGPGIRVGRCE